MLFSLPALACGGFFCDGSALPPQTVPVQQTEEAVVFAVDPVAGQTEMHVQISYEGPVNEFAWILPVPGVPAIERSSQRLFDYLQSTTREVWTRTDTDDASCFDGDGFGETDADTDADSDADSDADADADVDTPVTVLATADVGPYATVTLSATDAGELVDWLQDNGYQIPDGLEPLLAPYIAPGMSFIALKLLKDRDDGDLEPIALTLDGIDPSIPMQLTAVAAAEDMPLSVYMLGPDRAMPDNYLHVERNLLRAVWPSGSQTFLGNQPELTAEAVDAAGGQAFATLYAGPVNGIRALPDLYRFEHAEDAADWLDALADTGLALTVSELAFIAPRTPGDSGISDDTFYTCMTCYPDILEQLDFDAAAYTDRFEERVLEPLEHANELLTDAAWLTRLSTALSPSEMTVDPRFRFVPGLDEVRATHTLDVRRSCGNRALDNTPYEIEVRTGFDDPYALQAPTQRALREADTTLLDWLRNVYAGPALRIESYAGGERVVLADNTGEIVGEEKRGCACDSSSSVLGASFLPLIAVLWRRRQKMAS